MAQSLLNEASFRIFLEGNVKVSELMTADPCCCSPDESIQAVAQKMRDNDCGSVPVVEAGRVVGIVTDRDLAVRAIAKGMAPDTSVRDVMTSSPQCCAEDDDVEHVERMMGDRQVRRVPVVNADWGCVGIVSQADLARAATSGSRVSDREVAATVGKISEPERGGPGNSGESRAQL